MLTLLLIGCVGTDALVAIRGTVEGTLDGEALPEMAGGYWVDVDDGPYASWLLEGGYAQVRLTSYADACETDTAYYAALEAMLGQASDWDALSEGEDELHDEFFPGESAGMNAEFLAESDYDLTRDYTVSDQGLVDAGYAWVNVWRREASESTVVAESGSAALEVRGAPLVLQVDADLGGGDTITVENVGLDACDTALPAYTSYAEAYSDWEQAHGGC